MARARRAINIKDGRLVMRTEATDALRGLYRPIPDDVAKAITDGKIKAKAVVSAIMKRERFSADDSDEWWDQFKKDEEALNIRRSKVDFGEDGEGSEKKELPQDDPKDMISLKELGVKSQNGGSAKGAKHEKTTSGTDGASEENPVEKKDKVDPPKEEEKTESAGGEGSAADAVQY